jgi:hypothetical protein
MRNKLVAVRHAKKRSQSPHNHSNKASSGKRSSPWRYFTYMVVMIILGFTAMYVYTSHISLIEHIGTHPGTPMSNLRVQSTQKPLLTQPSQASNHITMGYNTSSYINEILSYSEKFKLHPLHQPKGKDIISKPLHTVMEYIYQHESCRNKPLFSTMANVISDLYWQMIENFMYTLAKYNHSSCALMICVSDTNCMKKCEDSSFPCYNFEYSHYHKVTSI